MVVGGGGDGWWWRWWLEVVGEPTLATLAFVDPRRFHDEPAWLFVGLRWPLWGLCWPALAFVEATLAFVSRRWSTTALLACLVLVGHREPALAFRGVDIGLCSGSGWWW